MQHTPTNQLNEPQAADCNQHGTSGECALAASGEELRLCDRELGDESDADAHQSELRRCEEIIHHNLISAFVETGKALKVIRDQDLYRQGPYGTFDEYLRRRWNVERTYAHRLIQAAEVYLNLLPIGNMTTLPTAEAQVRPLTRLEPPLQQKAWKMAVRKAGQFVPTAKDVAASVRIVAPRSPAVSQMKKSPVGERVSDEDESSATDASPVRSETVPLVNEVEIVADGPSPSELHVNAEVPVEPADGVSWLTPVDDTEQSARKSEKDSEASQPAGDGEQNDPVSADLPASQTLIESRDDADLSAVPPSAPVALDHPGNASPGVHPNEQQVLIPAEIVEQAARSVSARDLGGSADPEMVALMRGLVAPVADLLRQLADAYPNFSGRELSQALGMVNTKLQIANGWV